MSDAGLKFPQRQGPLQELILESDPQKLPEGVYLSNREPLYEGKTHE